MLTTRDTVLNNVPIKMIVTVYIASILFLANSVDAKIGMNWGICTKATIIPSMMVDLFLQNDIEFVRIFDDRKELIRSFCRTGISVAIDLLFPEENVTSFEGAKAYVQKQIVDNSIVDISYIHIGNNAFAQARNTTRTFDYIVNVFKWIHNALIYHGIQDKTKVVVSNTLTGLLKIFPNNSRPSDADFRDDVKEYMLEILHIYNQTNTPFMFDLFPLAYIVDYHIDLEYAFFDNKSSFVVTDINGFQYRNMFDFVYDSFVWLLEKYGFGNLDIICTQIGWPTDSFRYADSKNAERFYKGLLPKVTSNNGTPMRPGKRIDVYIHTISDENMNPIRWPCSRHWGIYTNNGQPKYKIDLSGQGRDIFPTSSRGVQLMPQRWCSYHGNTNNWTLVQEQFDYACSLADCTSLMPGSSCGMLSAIENVTYAFNAYYQTSYQDEKACDFKGLGQVTVIDPSRDGCKFSVELARGSLHGKFLHQGSVRH